MLVALKRFLINAQAHARTRKRGGDISLRHMEDSRIDSGQFADDETPEQAFERSWALSVLDAAMHRLRAEAREAGKLALFDQLAEFLAESPDAADYERAAQALKLRRNTLAVAVHRLRHRLRQLVRAELEQTTDGRESLEEELRALRASLAGIVE